MTTSAAIALPDAPQGLRVETIADPASFLGMRTTWNLLVHQAGIHHPFLRHEWVRTWWECFGRGRQLCVLLVKDGHDPIALAPLMLSEGRICGIRVRQLELMANVHSSQLDFIVSRWPQEAYRAIWAHLAEQGDWDVMQLRDLPEGSATLDHLPRLAGADGFLVGSRPSGESPAVPLVGGWDAYFRGLRPKHRSNLRNRFKRLARIGTVERELASPADSSALDDALRIEAEGWKGRAGTAILRRPETEQFYRKLAAEAADRGWLRLHFLRVGERRIAFQYTLEYGDRIYALALGYDPAFAPYSPQNLLCSLVIEDAFSRHLLSYEFLGAREEWKMEWAPETRRLERLVLIRDSPRGRLLHLLKFRLLPRLRRERLYVLLRDLVLHRRRPGEERR